LSLWYALIYETIFARSPQPRLGCARSWYATRNRGSHVLGQSPQSQTLAEDRRETDDLAPRPATGGPDLTISPEQEDALRAQVAATPDARLSDHAAQWNATHGITLSASTLGRAMRRLGITRKKRR
jgi:hypothetical protein